MHQQLFIVYLLCIHIIEFTSVRSVNCTAFLNSTSNEGNSSSFVEWWTLIPLDDPGLYANDAESQELYMYVYSEQVIPPIFSTISGIGYVFPHKSGCIGTSTLFSHPTSTCLLPYSICFLHFLRSSLSFSLSLSLSLSPPFPSPLPLSLPSPSLPLSPISTASLVCTLLLFW